METETFLKDEKCHVAVNLRTRDICFFTPRSFLLPSSLKSLNLLSPLESSELIHSVSIQMQNYLLSSHTSWLHVAGHRSSSVAGEPGPDKAEPHRKTSSLCNNSSKTAAQYKTALYHVPHAEIRQCVKNYSSLSTAKVCFRKNTINL